MRSSICCFCSTVPHTEDVDEFEQLEEVKSSRSTPRSPYLIKEKCRNLMAWIGKGGHKHYASSDFSYDPMSYALNFEDESSRADELPFVNFSSRLRSTPDRLPAIKHLGETQVPIRREVCADCKVR
ncbi:histidine-rich glycoprotein-like [Gossypium australe]|uniref:Histidine-rich glycoprotein-like n=3 Tax=Gossypium TaxID=3633 RepID=A0A5B6ULF5_9ROSI|nr:histidine-rich glycoprotein-like [Gossypium australe]